MTAAAGKRMSALRGALEDAGAQVIFFQYTNEGLYFQMATKGFSPNVQKPFAPENDGRADFCSVFEGFRRGHV